MCDGEVRIDKKKISKEKLKELQEILKKREKK